MSKLTGAEPWHWHDDDGQHRMADPRHLASDARFWDRDERAYVAHLQAHDDADADPQPAPDDSEAIRVLFALVAAQEAAVRTTKELIVNLRLKRAASPPLSAR